MKETQTERIAYGDRRLTVRLPERARVIDAKPPMTPVPDIRQAVRDAIENPIAHEPLRKLAGPKSRVTIAFDDASGSYFQTKRTDFRQVAIELIVEELTALGVDLRDITLLCGPGAPPQADARRDGDLPGPQARPLVRLQQPVLPRRGGPRPARAPRPTRTGDSTSR